MDALPTRRSRAFAAAASALRAAMAAAPSDARTQLLSSRPFMPTMVKGADAALSMKLQSLHEQLVLLDAASPLEKDEGVREAFVLDASEGGERMHLWIKNDLGHQETITVLPFLPELAEHFEAWCRTREETTLLDTSWDRARLERRVVGVGTYPELIDRGANRLIDIVLEAGGSTRFSCEGHPQGAYLVFEDDADGRIERAFASIGWRIERKHGIVARMPKPKDLPARDAMWRETCDELERILGIAPGPSASISP